MLEPDRPLPYQVFARDSSVMTPGGAVVTQMAQPWRRGEYAEVIRFYQRNEIPIANMITAGSLEGGDVCMVEPGVMLIGNGEERTTVDAARQLAGWMEAEGWEVRIEPIPSHFLHIDVLVSILAPKLAAVCVESASGGLVAWLRDKDFEIVEVSHRRRVQARGQRDLRSATSGCSRRAGSAEPQRTAAKRSGSRSSTRTSRCSRWAAAAPTASPRRSTATRAERRWRRHRRSTRRG